MLDHENSYTEKLHLIRMLSDMIWAEPHSREKTSIAHSNLNWNEVILQSAQTKTLGILADAVKMASVELPTEIADEFKKYRSENTARNFNNLAETFSVITVLAAANITAVAFKGSVRSFQVYGGWGTRSSSDVDILVTPETYEKAKFALIEKGYNNVVDPRSKWWHHHLGESPFQKVPKKSTVVDLHFSLQQPGGPFPRNLKYILDHAVQQDFGKRSLFLLNNEDALLVTTIGYGKAVRAGEPWLRQAHELAYVYAKSSSEERAKFETNAAEQGLARLYKEAMNISLKIFDPALQDTKFSKDTLVMILGAFGMSNNVRFFRTKKLWAWTDGGPGIRSIRFLKEIIRVQQSEAALRFERRKGYVGVD